MFSAKNPSAVIGRKGAPGWPELRGEIHTKAHGIGGYLSKTNTLTNADGATCWEWRATILTDGAYSVEDAAGDFYPLVVRMPHGRFLAGWTMGEGMITSIPELDIVTDEDEAKALARECARIAAEHEAEYQEEQMGERIEQGAESKIVCIREGSAVYTADEQCQNLIDEACALLDCNPEQLANIDPEDADFDEHEALEENARLYEEKLESAGYTIVWNDGFVIYKDLTDEELEYVNEF